MITLYSKDFTTKYGPIDSICEAFVEEERNGLFELSFVMLNTDSLFNYIKEENIVVVNANDTLLNQKFRIYMTRKLMNNRVEVFARHISFDLMYDYIDNISFDNQSCEYALNQLFRNSNFSTHYKGYSNIVNAQNYKMSMANVLEAIGGKKGSIIDTFGTGAEILRDNENIHVLNKRGHDNDVVIEYRKNLTGFELEEDNTDLVTRILPYAKYNDEETNEEVILKANYVDSSLINNYSHPYIKHIDYSEKFEDNEIPTVSKLQTLANNEYKNNKVDIPKQNFKIEFIPLSKCVGYEGLEDKISLCDTVTIKDTRYNINTQAKVIKVIFNVLKNRYESMELGEPRTSLGDIVGGGNSEGAVGPQGPPGPPGQDGNVENFPNTLPSTPIVTTKVYGFSNIEISWTFENKAYYQYEVYASKTANFTPNTFNLIHQGQTSTYMYQAKPNETWYFKVCAINSHGNRTSFGSASATTVKIEDLSNYVEEMAINDALIGTLNLGRGWFGELKGNYIDAKNLSVTDGNGKRTLDIDDFGNVNIDATSISLNVNTNPIIRLFPNGEEYCAIDACVGGESGGFGNNVRLKLNAYDFVKVNPGSVEIFTQDYKGSPIYSFYYSSTDNENTIRTPIGYLKLASGGLYWRGSKYATEAFVSENYLTTSSASNTYLTKTSASNTYLTTSSASNTYSKISHTHDRLSAGSLEVIAGSGGFYPSYEATLGTSSKRWNQIYSSKGSISTSDKKLKTNINYLHDNFRNIDNETKFLDFIKNDFNPATFNFIDDKDNNTNNQFGFIAQDIYNTDIGKLFIYNLSKSEEDLVYSTNGYATVIATALKEEIQKREELEERVNILEKQIQKLLGGINE